MFTIKQLRLKKNCEQNWVGDIRIGCKPFSSLVKIIGVDLELEEFERTLERDRIFENIVYYFLKM
jgi:hypothetical protein